MGNNVSALSKVNFIICINTIMPERNKELFNKVDLQKINPNIKNVKSNILLKYIADELYVLDRKDLLKGLNLNYRLNKLRKLLNKTPNEIIFYAFDWKQSVHGSYFWFEVFHQLKNF